MAVRWRVKPYVVIALVVDHLLPNLDAVARALVVCNILLQRVIAVIEVAEVVMTLVDT